MLSDICKEQWIDSYVIDRGFDCSESVINSMLFVPHSSKGTNSGSCTTIHSYTHLHSHTYDTHLPAPTQDLFFFMWIQTENQGTVFSTSANNWAHEILHTPCVLSNWLFNTHCLGGNKWHLLSRGPLLLQFLLPGHVLLLHHLVHVCFQDAPVSSASQFHWKGCG